MHVHVHSLALLATCRYKELFKPLLDFTKEMLGKKIEKVRPTESCSCPSLTIGRVHALYFSAVP